ncbi:Factor of DNA methylation 4 [Glycine soja]
MCSSVNKKISEMESKYIEDYMSLDKMMKEIEKKRDLLHQTRAEASSESVKLCAKWQKEILDSTWHPFKIVEVEGKEIQEVIDENDPKLLSLKNDLGEEAYVAVVTALKQSHEYHNSDDAENTHNSSEKQVIPEI